MKSKEIKIKDCIGIILIFLVFNFIISLNVKILAINPDEINVLAIPAKLSGNKWYLVSKLYYGWGGAIFYYPLFALIKNPIIVYRSIILVNSILLSFIPCISYIMLEDFFKIYDRKLKLLISFFLGIYPGTFSMAQYGWNETWVRLITWVILFILLKLVYEEKKRKMKSFFLGFLLAYSYAIHGRMIVLIPVIIIIYLYFFILKKRSILNISFGLIGFILMFFIDKIIKGRLQIWFFLSQKGSLINTFSDTVNNRLKVITDINAIMSIIRAMFSYLFYINITSFGILALALVLLIKLWKENNVQNIKYTVIGIFSVIGIVFSSIIGALFFAKDFTGVDNFYIYGRYTDHFTSVIILFIIVLIIKKKIDMSNVYQAITITLVHSVFFLLIESNDVNSKMVDVNITTLMSFSPNYVFDTPEKFYMVILLLIIISVYMLFIINTRIYLALIMGISIYGICNINLGYRRIEKSEKTFEVIENKYQLLQMIRETKKEKISLNFITDGQIPPAIYLMILNGYNVNYTKEFVEQNIFSDREELSLVSESKESFMLDNNIYKLDIKNNKNNKFDLYYKGDELKNILENKKITAKKHNTYVIPLNNIYTTSNSKELNNGIVKSNSIMYGPYIELRPNSYQIIITGENLDKDTVFLYTTYKNRKNEKIAMGYKVIKKEDNQFIGEIEVSDFIQDFETIIENNSNEDITIKSMIISVK